MNLRIGPKALLWLVLSLFAGVTAWLYMHRVLGPWEHYFNVEAGTMRATLGDLYSPWFGSRELLLRGKNPYGPEVTHDIQIAFYGHDIRPAMAGQKIVDEQRFAYPTYVVFLLAPTVKVEFDQLQAFAPLVLAAVVVCTVWLWLSVLRWRPPRMTAWAATLFMLASPQMAQGLRLRQLGLIVACLLALATWLVVRNHLVAAGAVLALATIKPQMMVLPLAWFLLWGLAAFRKRWRLLAGFGIGLASLVGAGELILPGWPRDFVAGLIAYRRYASMTTLLQLALGRVGGATFAVLIIAALVAWGWKNAKQGADAPEFAWRLSAFFMGAALALPLMSPFNQVLLIPPVLMLLRDWGTLPSAARVFFAACVSWPWLAELALLVLPLHLKSLRPIPLLPSALVLLLPFFLPLLLRARRIPVSSAVADS